MPLKIERAPLEQMQAVLPQLLSNLSIARAQIAIEQIRSHLQTRPRDEILFYLARDVPISDDVASQTSSTASLIAALIAIRQPGISSNTASDVITIVHAGFVNAPPTDCNTNILAANTNEQAKAPDTAAIISQMRFFVEEDFYRLGIRFAQWATEATDQQAIESLQWNMGLDFDQIATLDYLSCDFISNAARESHQSPDRQPEDLLHFRALNWGDSTEMSAFTRLVEQTYEGTLDCPSLANFRTTAETLGGYQTAASFAPHFWYEVRQNADSDQKAVGCLILAEHPPTHEEEALAPSNDASQHQDALLDSNSRGAAPVIEIVYMGLLPAFRGKGLGQRLVEQATRVARSRGGDRFILGVDRQNQPARQIYQQRGMTTVLSETVWVKRVTAAAKTS